MRTPSVVRGSQYDILDDNTQSTLTLGVGDSFSHAMTNVERPKGLIQSFSSGNAFVRSSSSSSIPSAQMLDDLFKWVWGVIYKVLLLRRVDCRIMAACTWPI